MTERALDIPVSDLPFEAGSGFVATVNDEGIAHIVVSMAESRTRKSSGAISKWIDENDGILLGVGKLTSDDPVLEAIFDKYTPELLDRR